MASQLQHLVELGSAVNTLVSGDESGHNPEQLQAVQDLVAKLNDDRRVQTLTRTLPEPNPNPSTKPHPTLCDPQTYPSS